MRLITHRKHADGYELRIEADEDLSVTALETDEDGRAVFAFPPDAPKGVKVKDYERHQQREAALLVRAALDRASAGKKVSGEGSDLTNLIG